VADQTAKGEFRLRAEHLGRAVKTGLSPAWVGVTAAVALVGGSVLLGSLWGIRHLIWGLAIFLAIAVFVITEGSYRLAKQRDAERAEQVGKLERERDAARTELEEMRHKLEDAPPFKPHHFTRKPPPEYGDWMTYHFVRVKNPLGQPERRARMSLERMEPAPRHPPPPPGDATLDFPHHLPRERRGQPAGLLIAAGQEQSWYIGGTHIGSDGKISVFNFFNDRDAPWELEPSESWRLFYRIECDGVPEVPFVIVMKNERGELKIHVDDDK
jgi:hypothetical protein